MDNVMLGALIAILKSIPDTAVSEAIEAKDDAEAAAALAQEYGYRITVEGKALVIGEEESNG